MFISSSFAKRLNIKKLVYNKLNNCLPNPFSNLNVNEPFQIFKNTLFSAYKASL